MTKTKAEVDRDGPVLTTRGRRRGRDGDSNCWGKVTQVIAELKEPGDFGAHASNPDQVTKTTTHQGKA